MDSVGEGEGGKIWENDIETCKISCKKRVASPGSMHDTGCLGLVHWDDPHGLGDGGAAQAQDWECNTGLHPSVNTRVASGELSCPSHLPGSTWTMRTSASKKLPTPRVSDSKPVYPLSGPEPHGACSPPAFTAQPSGSCHLPSTSWESSVGYAGGRSALCA